jgi:hypothetical protein
VDLIEFLRARLDEDEAPARAEVDLAARLIPADEFRVGYDWARFTEHVSGGSGVGYAPGAPTPARVLAEVEAKRLALLTRDQGVCTCGVRDGYENPPTDPGTREPIPHHYDCAAYEAALIFVQVYAEHTDFDPAWLAEVAAR